MDNKYQKQIDEKLQFVNNFNFNTDYITQTEYKELLYWLKKLLPSMSNELLNIKDRNNTWRELYKYGSI